MIDWNPERNPDEPSDFPAMTLEPVVAWVTARVQRKRKRDGYKWKDVIIAPLVRYPVGGDLVLADKYAPENETRSFVYLAPGEELSHQHFEQLRGGYTKAVTQC